jgi:hypothetical protein
MILEILAKELAKKHEEHLYGKYTTDEDWSRCVECAYISVKFIKEMINDSDAEPVELLERFAKEINKL